ncbi:hypothetical protein AALP_AA2G094600 [Arabis alpina]|uniref:Uncharacterized protein n=1 Tax=Arabis alpina TaxID=50452 RepID=A0A087HGB6_ARAAL|nr:hypothetical protein AALP_AA2G094600 [Arabis alpina]
MTATIMSRRDRLCSGDASRPSFSEERIQRACSAAPRLSSALAVGSSSSACLLSPLTPPLITFVHPSPGSTRRGGDLAGSTCPNAPRLSVPPAVIPDVSSTPPSPFDGTRQEDFVNQVGCYATPARSIRLEELREALSIVLTILKRPTSDFVHVPPSLKRLRSELTPNATRTTSAVPPLAPGAGPSNTFSGGLAAAPTSEVPSDLNSLLGWLGLLGTRVGVLLEPGVPILEGPCSILQSALNTVLEASNELVADAEQPINSLPSKEEITEINFITSELPLKLKKSQEVGIFDREKILSYIRDSEAPERAFLAFSKASDKLVGHLRGKNETPRSSPDATVVVEVLKQKNQTVVAKLKS